MKGLQYWGNMVKSMLLHCEEVEVVLCFDEVEICILTAKQSVSKQSCRPMFEIREYPKVRLRA